MFCRVKLSLVYEMCHSLFQAEPFNGEVLNQMFRFGYKSFEAGRDRNPSWVEQSGSKMSPELRTAYIVGWAAGYLDRTTAITLQKTVVDDDFTGVETDLGFS